MKKVLEQYYKITINLEGRNYVGIDLKWDYQKRTVDTSVPGYVEQAVHKVQHKKPTKPQDAPAKAVPIQYGARAQKHEQILHRNGQQKESKQFRR